MANNKNKKANIAAKSKAMVARSINNMGTTAAAKAYALGQRSVEPRVSGSYRSTRIVHRELVATVYGSTTFNVNLAIALNPGLSTSFPWLSTQAVGWEQYKFHKLKFCYYTRCSTATSGSVMLVPDYDAADPAPISEQVASAYRDTAEEVPWVEHFACTLDPSAMYGIMGRKYVRTAGLGQDLDIKTYDSGNMFVCTTDGAVTTGWGKLWVEYDVELYVPQLPPTGLVTGSYTLRTPVASPSNLFANNSIVQTTLDVVSTAINSLNFAAAGFYEIALSIEETAASSISTTLTNGIFSNQEVYERGGATKLYYYGVFQSYGAAVVNFIVTGTIGAAVLTVTRISEAQKEIAKYQ